MIEATPPPTTMKVTSHNADNHFELYESNTPNITTSLNFTGYECMTKFLYLITTLKLGNTYDYDDVKINSHSIRVVVTYFTYPQTEIKHRHRDINKCQGVIHVPLVFTWTV